MTGTNSGATPAPAASSGEFAVASFNMERFFDDQNDPNIGEPVPTTTAYNNRLTKASRIVRTVQRYPDVIGVQEVENLSTLQTVAARINSDAVSIDALPNPNYVAYLSEGNDIGGIDVGFLVKESRVTTVDVTQIEQPGCDHVTASTCNNYTNPNDGGLDILNDRPPLVLRATVPRPAGGTAAFTVINNHLRSLNNIDDTTVQGSGTVGTRVRMKRQKGAEFLANYIQSRQTADPNEKIVTVGGLNAFRVNDGYADVIGTIQGGGEGRPVLKGVKGGGTAEVASPQDTDEFVEFYNNTNSDITVSTLDGSAGWALVASDGVTRFIIPNETVIPARGHFLAAHAGYSLEAYTAPDEILLPSDLDPGPRPTRYSEEIPDGSGIAVFSTADPANFTLDNRLDAAGYAAAPSLYREGAGFPAAGLEASADLEYSFVRRVCGFGGVGCGGPGLPKDTADNTADFVVVNTTGASTVMGAKLGAPGPQGLSSAANGNPGMPLAALDTSVSASQLPNRVRTFDPHPSGNGTFGTLSVRRTITNNTGAPVQDGRLPLLRQHRDD